jgi:hypothetical protein
MFSSPGRGSFSFKNKGKVTAPGRLAINFEFYTKTGEGRTAARRRRPLRAPGFDLKVD